MLLHFLSHKFFFFNEILARKTYHTSGKLVIFERSVLYSFYTQGLTCSKRLPYFLLKILQCSFSFKKSDIFVSKKRKEAKKRFKIFDFIFLVWVTTIWAFLPINTTSHFMWMKRQNPKILQAYILSYKKDLIIFKVLNFHYIKSL